MVSVAFGERRSSLYFTITQFFIAATLDLAFEIMRVVLLANIGPHMSVIDPLSGLPTSELRLCPVLISAPRGNKSIMEVHFNVVF
jgi:hypothetical protein